MITFWVPIVLSLYAFLFHQQLHMDKGRTFQVLIFIVIPGACTIFSTLWLDQVYRVIRAALFLLLIEQEASRSFQGGNRFLFWEQHLEEISRKGKFRRVSRLYYYVCLGTLAILYLSPILYIGALGFIKTGSCIFDYIVYGVFGILSFGFGVLYLSNIKKIRKEKRSFHNKNFCNKEVSKVDVKNVLEEEKGGTKKKGKSIVEEISLK